MTRPLLCRELVGLDVVLQRPIETRGGIAFRRGELMRVRSTWRGLFDLEGAVPLISGAHDGALRRSVSKVHRSDFRPLGSGSATRRCCGPCGRLLSVVAFTRGCVCDRCRDLTAHATERGRRAFALHLALPDDERAAHLRTGARTTGEDMKRRLSA